MYLLLKLIDYNEGSYKGQFHKTKVLPKKQNKKLRDLILGT